MSNENRKAQADRFLFELGLWNKLGEYGNPHIIGSYRMEMMVCNDLDIDIVNTQMSMDKLYELMQFILHSYKPVWYEAKQEINDEGKTVWFHGFETTILGELWNFDIWFLDEEAITRAEVYCDNVYRQTKTDRSKKLAIITIKEDLISRGLYTFDQFTSMDVYNAVLNDSIYTTEDFLIKYT